MAIKPVIIFLILLCLIGVLWHIIGYWRRKAGEAAYAAARMADNAGERDRYCRLAVMAGHRDACRMFCFSHPDLFEDHLEKPRDFDPFGHAGLPPLATI